MKTLRWHLQISYISRNFVSVGAEILLKYLQQALSRVLIHLTQIVRKKWKLRIRLSPNDEGEPRASNEDFDEDWLRRFLECGVQVKNRTKKNSSYWMFSLLRLCFVFNGEIYATEWAVFVSVDITFYSFALSYLLDFSFLHHSCRRIFTVFYVTTMKHDRFGRILIGDTFWPPNRTFNTQKMIKLLTVRILAILRLTVNRIMTYWR